MDISRKRIQIACSLAITWIGFLPSLTQAWQVELTLPKNDPCPNPGGMAAIAYSPDGKYVAVGYGLFFGTMPEPKPGQTILWDARSGKRVATIPARQDGIHSVLFSPDGKILAVLEYPGIVRWISVPDGREIRRIVTTAKDQAFTSAAFFPDGKKLAVGLGAEVCEVPGKDVAGKDAAVNKDSENKILILDVAGVLPKRTLAGHRGRVSSLAISSDGLLVAAGGDDGTVRIWDVSTGKLLKTLTFSGLRKRMKEAGAAEDEVLSVESVAFSPDGQTLATLAGSFSDLEEIELWEISNGKSKGTLRGISPLVDRVVFSPDGKRLASAGKMLMTITLWNPSSLQKVETIEGLCPIAFSTDGKALAHGKQPPIPAANRAADEGPIVVETIPTIVLRKLPTRN